MFTNVEVPYVQIVDGNDITQTMIYTIHQQQLAHNKNNSNNSNKLIEILGGIDQILIDYLSSHNQMHLNQTQLQQIHATITSQPDDNFLMVTQQTHTSNYCLNICDTLIQDKFGIVTGTKIIQFLFNKLLILILALLHIVYRIWDIKMFGTWYNGVSAALFFEYRIIVVSMGMIWYLSVLLSVNQKALKLSCQTFVFWFKIVTIIKISIEDFILVYVTNYFGKDVMATLDVIGNVELHLAIILLIAIIGSIDGYNITLKTKLLLGIVISLYFSIWTIYITFTLKENDKSKIIIGHNIQYSVLSSWISGYQMLSIFLWKQTILLIWNKDKAVNISHHPTILWY
eukprot:143959_1